MTCAEFPRSNSERRLAGGAPVDPDCYLCAISHRRRSSAVADLIDSVTKMPLDGPLPSPQRGEGLG
jgi:hypothetical protein